MIVHSQAVVEEITALANAAGKRWMAYGAEVDKAMEVAYITCLNVIVDQRAREDHWASDWEKDDDV